MTPNDAPILYQSVRWGENYVSQALNIKAAGIIPTGVYHGYQVKPCNDMAILIDHDEDYPRSVAVIERDGYSLTVIMDDPGKITIPAPGNWFICIEAFYNSTKQGYQRIVAREKVETHHVVLASVKADGTSPLEISYAERQNAIFPKEVLEFAHRQQMENAAQTIRISDRLTRQELVSIERQAEMTEAIRACNYLLSRENEDRSLHEAEAAKIVIPALDRITRLELAFLEGLPSSYGLSPSGYALLSGARVAPVTIIVGGGTEAPANAALGLRFTEIEQGD